MKILNDTQVANFNINADIVAIKEYGFAPNPKQLITQLKKVHRSIAIYIINIRKMNHCGEEMANTIISDLAILRNSAAHLSNLFNDAMRTINDDYSILYVNLNDIAASFSYIENSINNIIDDLNDMINESILTFDDYKNDIVYHLECVYDTVIDEIIETLKDIK